MAMQFSQRVSEAERRFLLDGVKQGLRNDGRGCFDCRRFVIESDPVPTATSSIRLRAGETDLIVALKCDVVRPSVERPNEGHFHINVECAASISALASDGHQLEDAGKQLSILLETLCANDEIIDRQKLCILPGAFAWEVYVDVLLLSSGGNLLDSMSMAICAVLSEVLLPKVEVAEAMEDGEPVQLSLDDRPELGTAFPLKRLPLCVTVAQVQDRFLLDVTAEEELCADAMLCVVVDAKAGDIIGLHKVGKGLFDVASLPSMLDRCRVTAAGLIQQLEHELSVKDVVLAA